jgi:hypothetical protein
MNQIEYDIAINYHFVFVPIIFELYTEQTDYGLKSELICLN